ncbi:MAG: hypothetical protein MI799_04110 [Desulfobacterales bacterium]|nr:hypothetical protein [Desulfobacterales bacterium]
MPSPPPRGNCLPAHLVSGRKFRRNIDENMAMGIVDTIISAGIAAGASGKYRPLKDL